MADPAIDPSTLPLKTPSPNASVGRFDETMPTTLPPEKVWAEFMRALTNSKEAVLWPNEVSSIRTLQSPLSVGTTLAVSIHQNGATMHYRVLRFEPPHLVEYASLKGHSLAGGATVSVESSSGKTALHWKGEYRGSEAGLDFLTRYNTAFFSSLAAQLKKLESAA